MTPQIIDGLPKTLVALDYFGTAAFAFSGTLTAAREDMGIVGAILLSSLTAVGGGTIRDTLLGEGRAFWLTDKSYFRVCLLVCISTLTVWPTIAKWFKVEDSAWPFCFGDAVGLAAFAICGARKGLQVGCSIEGATLAGFLTACGGGVVRDIICNKPPRALYASRSAYATPAILGAVIYIWGRTFVSEDVALLVGFFSALGARVLAFSLKITPLKATSLAGKRE